jgi:hypothetical protein
MFWNLNQFVDHNKKFFDAMVDLKVVGWKSFADASDAYTSSFFTKQINDMTKYVEKSGENMKQFVKEVYNVK